MSGSLPVIAGMVSTTLFAASAMPMLVKAARTRDLDSYSLSHLVLANIGNIVHSCYVFTLPMGPIWLLHTFYLVSAGLMLFWYLSRPGEPRARARFRTATLSEPLSSPSNVSAG